MADEPMTDERLAEIAAYWEGIYHNYYLPDAPEPPDTLHNAICQVDELLGVIRQQQAQISAMRPIVEAVATGGISYSEEGVGQCVFCLDYGDDDISLSHTPECPIAQTRAYVATHPAAEGGDEKRVN